MNDEMYVPSAYPSPFFKATCAVPVLPATS